MADLLLVEEDRALGRGVRSLLRGDGHGVVWTRDAAEWRAAEGRVLPEVVVATVRSTDTVIRAAGEPTRGFPPPILFVHHETELMSRFELEDRLVDCVRSPFTAEELLARVDALVKLRRVVLRGKSGSRAAGARGHGWKSLGGRLRGLLGRRVPRLTKPLGPYMEVVNRAAEWADRRDGFEPGHAERVTSLVSMMAEGLRLSDRDVSPLLRAAMLHDLGKVGLPSEVLKRRGPLDEDQMRLLRTHPERGVELLRALDPDPEVADAIRYHHERVDGSGYYGKRGPEIPKTSRILAVAEVYDAVTTSQVREAQPPKRALDLLREGRGSQFDDGCVDALVEALRPRRTFVPLSDLPLPIRPDPPEPTH